LFAHACKLGFEGIVSKDLGSPYRSGRSRDWLKMKNPNAPELGQAEMAVSARGQLILKRVSATGAMTTMTC
jgi:ATP-dependent DNA ligase